MKPAAIQQDQMEQTLSAPGDSQSLAETSERSSPWLWYGLCIGLYALIFYFWQAESVPLEVYAAGLLLWAVVLVPLALWYRGDHRSVPIFELICVAYGAAYSLPIFLVPNQLLVLNEQRRLTWSVTLECTLLVTLGVVTLMSGYYGAMKCARALSVPRVNLPLSPQPQRAYVNLALVGGFIMSMVLNLTWSAEGAYAAIIRLLATQLQIGITLLAYEVFSARKADAGRRCLLWGSTGAAVLLALTGGMLEGVVLPIVLVLIVRWQVRGRFPIVLATSGVLLFLVLNPLKQQYRERAWYGDYGESGVLQRLGLWGQLLSERVQGKESDVIEEPHGFREAMERIDLLHKFAHVRSVTPTEIPYLGGVSYEYMLFTYIPRFLWPEKPVATEATDLVDFTYGFRSPLEENKGTKIAIGQVAEAYANLGITGIVVVMLVQGIFFALLNHVLNGPQSIGGRAIYLAAMVAFLNGIGTSAVILFGALIQFVIASAILIWLFTFGFDGAPPVSESRSQARRRRTGRKSPA